MTVATRPRLRAYLGPRLRLLALAIASLVTISAPLAYYVLGLSTLRVQADAAARQVADVLRSDAEQRPTLWKYDSLKLLGHLRNYELQESIARIEVVDANGRPIDPTTYATMDAAELERYAWQSADVVVNRERVAQVWVAMSTRELRRDSLGLLALFGLLGGVVAGLVYWMPMRSIARAERQIGRLLDRLEASQRALATLNEDLERQVGERSSQLSSAYHELQRKEQNLRDMSTRAVELQEDERRAIARDLHDSAGQTLTAIRINLQLLGDELARGAVDPRTVAVARRTTELVDETVEEIRRAVKTLGPAVLEDVGLVEALARMCDDVADRTDIAIDRHIDVDAGTLPPVLETTCYRVIQEALTNISRHAKATRVDIDVAVEGEDLRISVADDGTGFDLAAVDPRVSRGLVGMRERVELLGGRLEVASRPGGGTRVGVSLPVRRR